MPKPIATTTTLKRITKYLILNGNENDIDWNELKKSIGKSNPEQFADAMRYLLMTGQVKVALNKTHKKHYFYNNYNSQEYKKLYKVMSNEKDMVRQEIWGNQKGDDTNENN